MGEHLYGWWDSRSQFDADARAVCQAMGAGYNTQYGKAARFLLAVMACECDLGKIVQLTGLSQPTVKKYRETWWVELCEKSDRFRFHWFDDSGGMLAFVLDTAVVAGKVGRKWDEEAKDFWYWRKPKHTKAALTYTSKTRWSARREGLVPMGS